MGEKEKVKPVAERILVRREYHTSIVHKVFQIPDNEMFMDIVYNKEWNKIVLTTMRD